MKSVSSGVTEHAPISHTITDFQLAYSKKIHHLGLILQGPVEPQCIGREILGVDSPSSDWVVDNHTVTGETWSVLILHRQQNEIWSAYQNAPTSLFENRDQSEALQHQGDDD